MRHYRYLVVGGGMAADAAVRGIREVDPDGEIGMIGAEPDPPYDRPPLTKGLWKGEPLESVWRGTDDVSADRLLARTVRRIDPREKRVEDGQGNLYGYERLLLATGGTPRRLPFDDARILYFRTLSDYRRLREATETGRRFAIVGGGFIGSELAAALSLNGKEVFLFLSGETIGGSLHPAGLSRFLTGHYRDRGVTVYPSEEVVRVEPAGEGAVVVSRSNAGGPAERRTAVDGVVAGIGIVPNSELAREAGLDVMNGIRVDETTRTSHPDVYAAGDVAAFPCLALGRRVRVEHEDNANTMGRVAGRNMAGHVEPYRHLPFFYSDLFDFGYEAVGDLDAEMETVEDWKDPFREGVVYYLREGRVGGVLLWNVRGQVDAARDLIGMPGPFRAGDLKGRLKAA